MRQNFDSNIWGPHAWFFLETICMAYPKDPTFEEKKHVQNFFYSLKNLLPCEKCRNNYIKHLKIYPLDDEVIKNRDNLFKWINKIHNSVDKSKTRSLEETFKYYLDEYNINGQKYTNNNYKKNKYLILIVILLIIIFILLFEMKKTI